MSVVALFLRPDGAAEVAERLASWLGERGHEVRLLSAEAAAVRRPELAVQPDRLVLGADLVVSLGGDGTMLRAAALAVTDDVPVLGVNLGDLGYLTAVEPAGAEAALARFLVGDHEVEERMRLELSAPGLPPGTSALNEAVVEKAGSGQTVRLDVRLDDVPFTSYVADGLILATATGSTAYSFSSRGPILDPKLRAIVTTPVAAHMLFDRSMVLDADCVVTAVVAGDQPAELSIDGQEFGALEPGAELRCTGAGRPTRLVTFGGRDFHGVLRSKLALGDR